MGIREYGIGKLNVEGAGREGGKRRRGRREEGREGGEDRELGKVGSKEQGELNLGNWGFVNLGIGE